MRRRFAHLALLTWAVSTTGCLSGFQHPLGSVRESFIDAPLLGAWVCSSNDEPKSIDLSFAKFDARQYLLQSDDHESEPYSHRVIATRIEAATFLSLRPIAPKADDEWTILQYVFDETDHLSLKLVDPQPFEDVVDDPAAVRDRLAGRLDDSEVITDLWSCTRPATQATPSEP